MKIGLKANVKITMKNIATAKKRKIKKMEKKKKKIKERTTWLKKLKVTCMKFCIKLLECQNKM